MEGTLPGYEHVIPFQTLIGTVKGLESPKGRESVDTFQTLIGTVKGRSSPRPRTPSRPRFKPS